MSATEQFVFKMVNQFYRDTQAAVRTALIADFIGKDPRTVRYILVRLEQREIIARRGQRGGWLPASRLVA